MMRGKKIKKNMAYVNQILVLTNAIYICSISLYWKSAGQEGGHSVERLPRSNPPVFATHGGTISYLRLAIADFIFL